jgi:hypothetical protein
MADARMPDEFYELARPLLPPRKRGRPARRTTSHWTLRGAQSHLVRPGHRVSLQGRPSRTGLLRRDGTHAAAGVGAGRHLGPGTPVTCVACGGWWSGRSAGSRDCGGCECVTIGRKCRLMPGPAWQRPCAPHGAVGRLRLVVALIAPITRSAPRQRLLAAERPHLAE